MRHYVVTQIREVEVTANTHRNAIDIAHAAFKNGQNSDNGVIDGPEGIWGNTISKIKTVEVDCRRIE